MYTTILFNKNLIIMNQEERNKQFRDMADSFIDLANKHCDQVESTKVGSAQLYATTRFCAFVVASGSKDLENYESEIDNAVDFFSAEFKKMLTENMDEYKAVFKQREEGSGRYEHLIKN